MQQTFRLDHEGDNEYKLEDEPAAIYQIVPPAYGFDCNGVYELVKSNGRHYSEVLGCCLVIHRDINTTI